MRKHDSIGVLVPEILLPRRGVDFGRWAVIACDQFTSQPEYWAQVDAFVGDAPSTLRMILPEVFLEAPDVEERIAAVKRTMRRYLDEGIVQPRTGLIYVERTFGGPGGEKTRKGLLLALDLERYDYRRGSTSLIRATEGTILERIPPRLRIREGAPLELPHILVLIDDPDRTVIEPIAQARGAMERLYDFDLMRGSGHLAGFQVPAEQEQRAIAALERLADPARFARKYGLRGGEPVLLFAMGDGNHSLATAKAHWDNVKARVGMDHPARYALVEIENVHDEALAFEPIHRVLFGVRDDVVAAVKQRFGAGCSLAAVTDEKEMMARVDAAGGPEQRFGLVTAGGLAVVSIATPPSNLAVGTLQDFLDGFLAAKRAERIDYVHGLDVVLSLGRKPGNAGFYLPPMGKSDLFRTVILDGALPRKTFSMGEAREKRFYLESRRIA